MRKMGKVAAVAAIALGSSIAMTTPALAAPTVFDPSVHAFSLPNYAGSQDTFDNNIRGFHHTGFNVESFINHTSLTFEGFDESAERSFVFHSTDEGGYNTIGSPFDDEHPLVKFEI